MTDYKTILEGTYATPADAISKYKTGENRIVTEQARYPIANIKAIFDTHILKPNYQRKYVWDNNKKSLLIESLILNIPIPPVFLYEVEFAKYEVMDGQQRLTTLLDFVTNKFALSGLKIWEELNGLTFDELPEGSRKALERRYISATILLKETTDSPEKEQKIKQFVFERLNTGGVQLKQQEIRNAIYSSKFNDLLFELSGNDKFRRMMNLNDENTKRLEDCELILRFFTYQSAYHLTLSQSTRGMLDEYMKRAQTFSDELLDTLKTLFLVTIDNVYKLFGEAAFLSREEGTIPEKMIYDAVMLAVSTKYGTTELKGTVLNVNHQKYDLVLRERDDFNGKYTAISNVIRRVNLMMELI